MVGNHDRNTLIQTVRDVVSEFVAERDWEKFHSPKNLSMSLSIEAAELMEHFQWISEEDSRSLRHDIERLRDVSEEIADVFCYTLALANELGIDLADAFFRKMEKNRAKYPAEQMRGRYGHDDPNPTT